MLLLVDLDGVVYRGTDPITGMPELLTQREAAGDIIVYVTNNSRWHRSQYFDRLQAMGAPVSLDRILTSARGTALALAHRPQPPRCVMVLGGPGLAREVRDAGLTPVAPTPGGLAEAPDAVVVGLDLALTYRRLSIAAEAVRAGALFVATNRDPVFPHPEGLRAGAGAMVAAVSVAGRREPDLTIGKPDPGLMTEAAASVGMDVGEAVVIGDGLRTDILGARRVGARSVLVLTGVTTREMAEAAPPDERPDIIARDAAELGPILDRLAG